MYERLGRYLWESGDSAATLAAYVAADDLLATEPPTPLRARVRANQAIGHAGIGDHQVAFQLATEALAMARAVGASAEEGRALIVVGVTEAMTGQPEAGIAKLRTALGIAAANGHLEDLHRAYSNLTYALENTGRMAEALAVAYEALDHSRRLGLLFDGGGMLLANVAILAFELGRWDEAAAVALDTLDHEVFARAKPYLSLVLAQVDVGRGRFGDAGRRLVETGRAMGSTRAPQLTGGHFAVLAEMAIWQRDPDTARRAVVDGLAALDGLPDHAQALWLCAFGLRVEADEAQRLAARGNQSAALAAVRARGQQFASQMDKATDGTDFDDLLPEPKALWLQCQGELARLHGTAAARRWERAGRYWDELGWRYPTAYTNWRQAEALLDDHDRGRNAGAVLQNAHRLARELRAEPLRHEIVRLAGRGRIALTAPTDGPAPAPAARPPRDRFKLTRRELQVLRLLSEGHTNRGIALELFITEKTASVHVSNILTKLGAGSRGEAAAIAHRLDLVPPDPDTVT